MSQRDYEQSPRGKYIRQRANAKKRFIGWEFTFETWWKLWEESGFWPERGIGPRQYYMCRKGDVGPYSPHNVEIKTHSQNVQESWDVRKENERLRLTEEEHWAPYPRQHPFDYPHEHLDRWIAETGWTPSKKKV